MNLNVFLFASAFVGLLSFSSVCAEETASPKQCPTVEKKNVEPVAADSSKCSDCKECGAKGSADSAKETDSNVQPNMPKDDMLQLEIADPDGDGCISRKEFDDANPKMPKELKDLVFEKLDSIGEKDGMIKISDLLKLENNSGVEEEVIEDVE